MPASSGSALPPYTPSPPVPSYSPEPAHNERRVEHTPRRAHAHTGNYIKKHGRETVILTDQDDKAEFPMYGRHASINGFVTVEDRETVSEVVLKIKGKMDVMTSESGSLSRKLVNDSYTLWLAHTSHTSACPSAVPFSVVLPTKFQDGDKIFPLPPTYEVPYIAVPGLYVKSSYTISVVVTRTRTRKFQFLTKSSTLTVPFNYCPRMRPWRPIQPSSSDFFSDVKLMPEEWRQVVAQMKPRPKSTAQPIDIHLFLPVVEIFGLEDTIPFHIQLTGPVSSLREFLPESTSTGDTTLPDKTTIQGTLVRQVLVDLHERKSWRNVVIGHAKLSSCPPGASSDDREASLDWDGEVRCKDNVLVGMFDGGLVKVQDFIVIELRAPDTPTSQFTTLRHAHPIKLVTDSWLDSAAPREESR
ncbi:hypothetical protein B0H10DRAFT_2208720 [Mycena sp. CBHHK59/15]|nr:hypothetical protein B0H10DRAFT_2208720 [Mycena sp. CBHHK59/15]